MPTDTDQRDQTAAAHAVTNASGVRSSRAHSSGSAPGPASESMPLLDAAQAAGASSSHISAANSNAAAAAAASSVSSRAGSAAAPAAASTRSASSASASSAAAGATRPPAAAAAAAAGKHVPPKQDDAILSVARVLHRHILLSRDELEAATQSRLSGWGSGYGSTRSTPRLSRAMGTPRLSHSYSSSSLLDSSPRPGWATPSSQTSSTSHLGSPSFGSPYSSLSTPPQMALDASAFGRRGPHPFDADVFDIDHYLARSYSVQVPLLARLAPVSLFEQRRQYHSVPIPPSVRDVWRLLKRLFDQARLNAECVIIALIYLERLMETRNLALTPRNWIPLVTTALLSATKVWDDHSSYNLEFAAILPIFSLQQMNHMERSFLSTISYELYISADTYAQYYFGLRSIAGIKETTAIPRYYHATGAGDGVIAATSKHVETKTGGGGGAGNNSASSSSSSSSSQPSQTQPLNQSAAAATDTSAEPDPTSDRNNVSTAAASTDNASATRSDAAAV